MQEKNTFAQGIVVEDVAVLIRADVHSKDHKLSVFDLTVAVLEIDTAGSDRFDLSADQSDSGFKLFDDKVVVVSFFIL
ncbi:hypothetical protein SDC9_56480 [bioreactor metagenome]|uniref:Uncharacterized protein n=1 Tax=bioreactor metagenome TaxID=1076179 RepID=A0A644X1W7_9ZZZZ